MKKKKSFFPPRISFNGTSKKGYVTYDTTPPTKPGTYDTKTAATIETRVTKTLLKTRTEGGKRYRGGYHSKIKKIKC